MLECEHGKYAVGYKCITINDNFFPGHFPQRAIMPGGRGGAAGGQGGPLDRWCFSLLLAVSPLGNGWQWPRCLPVRSGVQVYGARAQHKRRPTLGAGGSMGPPPTPPALLRALRCAMLCCAAGVLQVEAMAQLGGIVMIDPADAAQQNNFFFGGVDNCRWRKPVVPGDVLVSAGGLLPRASCPCSPSAESMEAPGSCREAARRLPTARAVQPKQGSCSPSSGSSHLSSAGKPPPQPPISGAAPTHPPWNTTRLPAHPPR